MYKYKNYIDVAVAIENLIIAYTIRNEPQVVKGLKLALDRVKNYGNVAEIMAELDNRHHFVNYHY